MYWPWQIAGKFIYVLLREMDVIFQTVGVFEEVVFHLATQMCHCIVYKDRTHPAVGLG